jgi:hypothetical protein
VPLIEQRLDAVRAQTSSQAAHPAFMILVVEVPSEGVEMQKAV